MHWEGFKSGLLTKEVNAKEVKLEMELQGG